ncbi:hypothetical protein NH26_14135 [Flammeovirga pacifica]|uniref:Uncharacterized protein n=1 Tax=Flammeovirga pacifica TaxID=915059 RepID=A0A1S1Z2D0_FLAPC|nr:hypothetical protein NH26_14135 [Flammeovirga pacifica]
MVSVSERVGWSTKNIIENIKTPLFDFEKFGTYFNIQGDSFLLIEEFKALPLDYSPQHYSIYGIILIFSFAIYLSSISGLTKIYHAMFFGVFALLIGTFHFENLHILHQIHDKAFTALVLMAFLGISYYFHVNQHISFPKRFFTFFILNIGITLFIQYFTSNKLWFIESITYCLPSLSIITLVFVIFSSMAIPFGILFLATFKNMGGSGDSFKHFIFFYVVYLLDLLYCYVVIYYQQDFQIYYLTPIILLLIATFVGLWVIKQQEELFAAGLRDKSTLFWIYISGAIIGLSTIAFHKTTYDESFISATEQMVVVSMLGFGAIFLIYILYNFYDVLKKNLQVYKVAFQPRNVDFLSTWGVGLLFVFGLLFLNSFKPYKHIKASYYNNLGDLEYINGQNFLAESYFIKGSTHHFGNFHSSYMLGQIAEMNKNKIVASVAYKNAYKGEQLEQAYIKSASLEIDKNNFLEAILVLKEGLNKYPKSEIIANNLGLGFLNINEMDSALFYLNYGIDLNREFTKTLKGNYIAISTLAKNEIDKKHLSEISDQSSIIEGVNQMALLNSEMIASAQNFIPELVNDSILNGDEVSYIYNYALNNSLKDQPEDISSSILKYINLNNSDYKQQLLFAYGWTQKSIGNQKEFLKAFKELNSRYGTVNGYYNFLIGLEALKADQYILAEHKLTEAWKLGQKSAIYPLAITYSILGDKDKSIQLFEFCKKLNIIEESDMKLIHHYVKTKSLNEFSEKDYFYQLLFNYQLMNDRDIIESLKGLSIISNREDLFSMILHDRSNNSPQSIPQLISLFDKQFDISEDLNAKIVTIQYESNLPIHQKEILKESTSSIVEFANHLITQDTSIYLSDNLFLNSSYQKYIIHQLVKKDKDQDAFNWASDAVDLNPYSELNVSNYLQVTIPKGMKDFASDILVESEYNLDEKATERINTLYSDLIEDYNKKINTWN